MDNCLLCLKKNMECMDIIQVNSQQWQEWNIQNLIEKHFWIMDSLLPVSWLCINCWQTLYNFHQFYMDIEKAHRDFGKLITRENAYENLEESKDLVLKVETILEPEILIDQYPIKDFKLNIKKEQDEKNDKNISKNQQTNLRRHSKEKEPKNQDPLKKTKRLNTLSQRSNKKKESCKQSKTKSSKQITQEMQTNNQELEILQTPTKTKKKYNMRGPKKRPEEVAKFLAEHFKMTCPICQIPMTDWEALSKHFEIEHKERTYVVCCKRKFVRRSELRDHVHVRHVDPEKFKCNQCGKVFAAEKFLENHILRHIPEEEKEFACPECGKKFAKQNFLDCHVRAVHLKRYMKICEICGKSIYPEELARHMLEHEGKSLPTVYCEICGAGVSQLKILKLHMKYQHPVGGKQTITCPICNKTSANAASLRRHMDYVHTKNIRKCTICGKGFKSARCLREHMATHTGVALHTCNWCPKTFNSNGNVSSHCRKHHPIEYGEERQRKHLERFKPPVVDETNNIGS